MPPIPLLTALLKHLDERGGSVGLLRRPLPLPLSHSHLWVAPYAFLLLTWISPESPPIRREHLEQLWLEGEAAVQRLLRTLPGGLRDPYLLLALSTPPPTTLLSTIRELESNPLVCRKQVLWPPHCVQDTEGAEFALCFPEDTAIISKATDPEEEAYSGFQGTDLDGRLKEGGIRRLFVGGLATDYCVLSTVKDALSLGYEVYLLRDAIRAVDPGEGERAVEEMVSSGAKVVSFEEMS